LYGESLADAKQFQTCGPLPQAKETSGRFEAVPVAATVPKFVEAIKKNRKTGSLDRILTNNQKCRFECVWDQFDDGRWFCLYCLDLYGWIDLGDRVNFEQRGCVGSYRRPNGGVPPGATEATRLIFKVVNKNPLNPFAD
jgi:hypothetical protein